MIDDNINDLIEDKLNVLIIAYYFPPMGLSGVQRTLKFVKYLPDFNWNPIVLTTGDSKYYAYDNNLLSELEAKNIEIFRTPTKKKPVDPDKLLSEVGRLLS